MIDFHETNSALKDIFALIDTDIETCGLPVKLHAHKKSLATLEKQFILLKLTHKTEIISSILRDISAYKRKLQRRIKILNEQVGTVKAPNLIIKTELKTLQGLLLDPEKEYDIIYHNKPDGQENAATIAEKSAAAIQKPESGYILDAIYKYTEAYASNKKLPISLKDGNFTLETSFTGPRYILKDTFDNFCKNGNITGEMRKKVKAALFPSNNQAGLLEYIMFFTPGAEKIIERRFIGRIQTESNKKQTNVGKIKAGSKLVSAPLYEPEYFALDIDAAIFEFLESIKNYSPNTKQPLKLPGYGYTEIPSNLNAKIKDCITALHSLNPPEILGVLKKQSPEKLRPAIEYIIQKWNRGKQNRTAPMLIEYYELSEKNNLLPYHMKNKQRRITYVRVLAQICLIFLNNKEAFAGCKTIEFTANGVIIFHLETGSTTKAL
jgi:hypothetical protein